MRLRARQHYVQLLLWQLLVHTVSTLGGADSTTERTSKGRAQHRTADKRDLIVGGSPASELWASYGAVSDPLRSGGLCGAALIHDDILVSAAHCGASGVFYIGSYMYIGSTVLSGLDAVDEIALLDGLYHPDYDPLFFGNDIMLLKLASPATSPIVPWNRNRNVPVEGTKLVVVGFGVTEEGQISLDLLEGQLSVMDSETCNDAFNLLGESDAFDDTTICAASDTQATCSGDSGSPVFTQSGTLVGLVSFGIRDVREDSCITSPFYPAGFTRLSAFADFITQGICELSANPPQTCSQRQSIPVTAPVRRPTRRPTPRPIRRPTRRPTPTPTPKRPITLAPVRPPPTRSPTRSPTTRPPTRKPLAFLLTVPPTRQRSAPPSNAPSHTPTAFPSTTPTTPSIPIADVPSIRIVDSQEPSRAPSNTPSLTSQSSLEGYMTFSPTVGWNSTVSISSSPSQAPSSSGRVRIEDNASISTAAPTILKGSASKAPFTNGSLPILPRTVSTGTNAPAPVVAPTQTTGSSLSRANPSWMIRPHALVATMAATLYYLTA